MVTQFVHDCSTILYMTLTMSSTRWSDVYRLISSSLVNT